MIPTEAQVRQIWDRYQLPEDKRGHVTLVADVARFLARQLTRMHPEIAINEPLLSAAAWLHDIDKNVPRLPGEEHPDTAVRILKEEGMEEVADLVKTHPLHAILDPSISPRTWEEKLLFLADKMVKHEVITVDQRFKLWNQERLPPDAQTILDASYPKVKQLETEIFSFINVQPADVKSAVSPAANIA